MLKIAICDDEKNVCDYIEKRTRDYLAKADEEAELAVFYDGAPLIEECKNNPDVFDIIFLDPPYALGLLDEVLNYIEEHKLLNYEGLIVCEFDNGTNVDIKGYKLLKDKRYGRVCVNILEQ